MPWVVIGEGQSLSGLKALDSNQVLRPGERVYAELTPKNYLGLSGSTIARAFDLAKTESAFQGATPPGMRLVDVYEENGKGVVVMEVIKGIGAVPLVLALVSFIAIHWLRISLTVLAISVVLAAVIAGVRLLLWIGGLKGSSLLLLVGAGLAAMVGLNMLQGRRSSA